MRKLCTKWFAGWSEKAELSNQDLLEPIDNIEKGLSNIFLPLNFYLIFLSIKPSLFSFILFLKFLKIQLKQDFL